MITASIEAVFLCVDQENVKFRVCANEHADEYTAVLCENTKSLTKKRFETMQRWAWIV